MHSAVEVANWFLAWTEDNSKASVNLTKLLKLVYYAQAHHLAIYDRPLFGEPIKAWKRGPVVYEVWTRFQNAPMQGKSILLNEDFDFGDFSDEENQFLIAVWNHYGKYTGTALSDLTHQEYPWINNWLRGKDEQGKSQQSIPLDELKTYYRQSDAFNRASREKVLESVW